MTELKPCPFCGGEAAIYDDRYEEYSVGAFGSIRRHTPTFYQCYCTSCGAKGTLKQIDYGCEGNTWWQKEVKQQAVNAWNRRSDNGN